MKTSSAAILAILLLAGCTSQQAPRAPQTTATPAASSASAGSTAPGAGPMVFEDIEPGTELAPGTYVLHFASIGGTADFPTLAITFTVPEGWTRVRVDGLVWNDNGVRLGFVVADNLYADPCSPAQGVQEPAVGPSVDDLTAALAATPGWEDAVVTEVAFYGYGGQRIALTVPADGSTCNADEGKLLHSLGSPGYTLPPGPGEQIDMRILNVAGTRLIIGGSASSDAPAEERAELEAVLDSIQIQP